MPRGQGRGGRRPGGRGGRWLSADRELAHRLGHDHLRSARGGVRRRNPAPDARDPLPRPPHADGRARRPARRDQAGALASRGAGTVPHLAVPTPARRRAGQRLGHGRQRRARGPGRQSGARGHRRAARGRRARPGAAGRPDRGRPDQPDPLPHLHPARRARAPRRGQRRQPLQDLAHRAARPQAGHAGAHPAGVRRAGREPDGAAVAPGALGTVDLPLLRGHRRLDHRPAGGGGAGGGRGTRRADGRAGQLRGLGRGLPPLAAAAHPGAPHQEARHSAGGPAAGPRRLAGDSGAADVRRQRSGADRRARARSRARR